MDEQIEKKKSHAEVGQENKQKILDLYVDYVQEHGKNPPVVWLAEQSQLTRPVVYKHLRALKLEDIGVKFKGRAITILEGIARKAEQGDYNCAKLIFGLAYNWNEKKQVDVNQTSKSIQVVFTTNDKKDIEKITNNIQQEDAHYEEINDDEQ